MATPVGELQNLLDNAGYNTGGESGRWTPGTASALAKFVERYGVEIGDMDDLPDDATISRIVAIARAKLRCRIR